MSIENIVEKGELLDCYGELLTKRQKDCLDLYYNENLTLAEIADYSIFPVRRSMMRCVMEKSSCFPMRQRFTPAPFARRERRLPYGCCVSFPRQRGERQRVF